MAGLAASLPSEPRVLQLRSTKLQCRRCLLSEPLVLWARHDTLVPARVVVIVDVSCAPPLAHVQCAVWMA